MFGPITFFPDLVENLIRVANPNPHTIDINIIMTGDLSKSIADLNNTTQITYTFTSILPIK